MTKLILASVLAAGPSVPVISFDGGAGFQAPVPLIAATPTLVPVLSAPSIQMDAASTVIPAWIDAAKLKFEHLSSTGRGNVAVLRHGWRGQFELAVFDFADDLSVSFKEHSSNPMGNPARRKDAFLTARVDRLAIAKILRDADKRNPVKDSERPALTEILNSLER